MPSKLQVVISIIVLFAVIFAFGWQVHEMWRSDIAPVVKGEDDETGN